MLYKIIRHYISHEGKYLNICKIILYLYLVIPIKLKSKNLKDSR